MRVSLDMIVKLIGQKAYSNKSAMNEKERKKERKDKEANNEFWKKKRIWGRT